MPLDDYRSKRNFAKSPEPPGDQARRATPRRATRFFCVQKHLASRLHYDLRLEHNGVLWSWAVPKGPSLDPAAKRLAMHVEDHPLEYGSFEGVIPEGYGAGIVMLWDYGTWQPAVDDLDVALRKGDLKFTLDGYKLKGSWVLVRTRDRSDVSPANAGAAGCSSSIAITGPGRLISRPLPRGASRATGSSKTSSPTTCQKSGSRTVLRGVAPPAPCLTQLIERATEKLLARTQVGRGRRVGQVGRVGTAPRNTGARASHVREAAFGRLERPDAEKAPSEPEAGQNEATPEVVTKKVPHSPYLRSRCDSTLHTAYAKRRRACRAICPYQNSPSTISQSVGTSPTTKGFLCSAA